MVVIRSGILIASILVILRPYIASSLILRNTPPEKKINLDFFLQKNNLKYPRSFRRDVMTNPLNYNQCEPCGGKDGEFIDSAKNLFYHALPPKRLGTRHVSLESFRNATLQPDKNYEDDMPSEFSLVAILSKDRNEGNKIDDKKSNIRILLGKKLRGFGKGFYNCFGGKLEKENDEFNNPASGAVREVREETGISFPLCQMENSYVGQINFTFEDWKDNHAMKVHLFCVFVNLLEDGNNLTCNQTDALSIHSYQIRGCDEIEPRWFQNAYDIPLHEMFADDTVWLTMLLRHYDTSMQQPLRQKLKFDAWFHFYPGGAENNSIKHHFVQVNHPVKSTPEPIDSLVHLSIRNDCNREHSYSFEKKLFHALHNNGISSPTIKEFKENWAMANAVRSFMKDENRMLAVIDVAGGHGALGALFLALLPKCKTAIVIDPAEVRGKEGVQRAWGQFWQSDRTIKRSLRYRHECLRTGLRDELNCILSKQKYAGNDDKNSSPPLLPTNILVLACHACQHLTDETLEIASEYGVNVAVMPCCQKDHDGWWKGLTKRLVKSNNNQSASLSIGTIMDLLAAGKMMGWETGASAGVRYRVKMKLMDENISPHQNRIIMCRAESREGGLKLQGSKEDSAKALAHEKLTRAYRRAHRVQSKKDVEGAAMITEKSVPVQSPVVQKLCVQSLLIGVTIGATLAIFAFGSERRSLVT
ncbi:hypothetical protein ACHAXS_007769 [Conticribra weissflogii]